MEKTKPHFKQDPTTGMNPYFVTTFLSDIFIYHTLLLFLSIEVDSRTDGSGTGFTHRSFFLIYKGNNKHFLKGLYKSLHLPTRAHWDSCKNVLPSSLKYLNRSPLQALNWAKAGIKFPGSHLPHMFCLVLLCVCI